MPRWNRSQDKTLGQSIGRVAVKAANLKFEGHDCAAGGEARHGALVPAVDAGAGRVAKRAGGTDLHADQDNVNLTCAYLGSDVTKAGELFGKHVQEGFSFIPYSTGSVIKIDGQPLRLTRPAMGSPKNTNERCAGSQNPRQSQLNRADQISNRMPIMASIRTPK